MEELEKQTKILDKSSSGTYCSITWGSAGAGLPQL